MFESEFERNLYALRQEKLKQIAGLPPQQANAGSPGLGQQAYPNTFKPPAGYPLRTIPQIRASWDGSTGEQLEAERIPLAVAGRIMAIRQQGKAGFATLQQDGAAAADLCAQRRGGRCGRLSCTSCSTWAITLA